MILQVILTFDRGTASLIITHREKEEQPSIFMPVNVSWSSDKERTQKELQPNPGKTIQAKRVAVSVRSEKC